MTVLARLDAREYPSPAEVEALDRESGIDPGAARRNAQRYAQAIGAIEVGGQICPPTGEAAVLSALRSWRA